MKRFVTAVEWHGNTDAEPITFVIDARDAGTARRRALGWARSTMKQESTGDEGPEPYVVGMVQLRLGTHVGEVSTNDDAGTFQLVFLT